MKPHWLSYFAVAALSAAPSFAQQVVAAKSGLLNYSEGDVTVNGEPVDLSGVHFSDIKENALVKTVDGRAEVLLTPGVVLRLGENSSLRMITNRLVDTRLELLTGSAVVEADQIAKDTNVTLVVKDGVVTLPKAGLYRFDAEPAQVKVFKGEAETEMAGNNTNVSSGHMMLLSGEATVSKFDAEDTDSLDRWSHRRGSYLAMANASAANSLMNSGGNYSGYGGLGYGGLGFGGMGLGYGAMAGWGMQGCSSAWAFNMYYNMMTYMPCYGSFYSPYGYRFWSPYTIGNYNGYAPGIWGGGASRTGLSSSGSASLARPVASASSRANAPSAGLGASRGAFNGASNGTARVGGPAIASGGGFSSGGSASSGGSFGGAGGGHASGSVGGGGGGGHAGGGGGHGH